MAGFPEDLKRFAGAIVTHDSSVAAILKTANDLQAETIVMGTHGKGELAHAFLDSVTEKVLRKSK